MKTILLCLLLVAVSARAAFFPNSLTTNDTSTNLFFDVTNKRVGINSTTTPPAALSVVGNGLATKGIFIGTPPLTAGTGFGLYQSGTGSYITFGQSLGGSSLQIGRASTFPLTILDSGLVGINKDSPSVALDVVGAETLSGSLTLNAGTGNTILSLNGSKVATSIANGAEGTVLGISNGVPAYIAGGGDTTNPVQNFYSSSNYYTVGKGGKLTVTNGITTLDVAASSLLRVDSNQKIAAATVGSGLSFDGTTLSATGGGGGSALYVNGTSVTNANLKDSGSVSYTTTATTNISPTLAAQAFNLLSYSGGTNVTIDCSLGNAMEAHYYLTVTNTTFFATPTSVPTTAKRLVMHLKNDSTGGYAVTFTNGTFSWSEGVMPIKTTNANYCDVFEFVTSPFTNTDLIGTMVQNVHR